VALTVTSKGYVGLNVDLDLAKSISIDRSGNYVINPVISADVVTGFQPEPNLVDTLGTVTGIACAQPECLNLKLQSSGDSVAVRSDGATNWSPDIGQLSSLRVGQLIEVNAQMENSGTYLAKFIGSSTADLPTTYEGLTTLVSQTSSGISFNVLVQR
jgi:hypothetical protein